MADLLTRLLLDSEKFDSNLAKSTKQIQGIERVGSKVSGAFSSSFGSMIGIATKFAGGIGLTVGAVEGFSKTINSTQTTGDAFVKMQDQMKAGVDSFFVACATGNFSAFLNNLDEVMDKAGRLSVILDNLGTKVLFNNAEYDDLRTQYQLEVDAAKQRNISDAERNKHLEKAKSILKEMVSLRSPLGTENKKAYYATLDADVAKQGFKGNVERKTWDYMMKDSNRSNVERSASNYNSWSQRISSSQIMDKDTGLLNDTPQTKKLKQEFAIYTATAQGRYEHLAATFLEMADDEKSAIANAIKMKASANAIAIDISSKQLEIANADAKINGSYNKNNKGKGDAEDGIGGLVVNSGSNYNVSNAINETTKGSIKFYKEEIQKLQTQLENITDITIAKEIKGEIERLQDLKNEIEFKINHPNAPIVGKSSTNLSEMANSDPTKGLDIKGIAPIYTKKDIKNTNDFAEGLTAVAQVMGNIQSVTNDASTAWLSYAGNILSSTAGMIVAVNALSAANTVEQQTASSAAGAEAVKSAAQTPLIGWLLVGAAAISVIAALASIPKYETGGIVGGNSYSGDKILARLNSGEMILNKKQQGNLANVLSNNGNNSSNVEFKIRGQELVGVLNNYNLKTSKLR